VLVQKGFDLSLGQRSHETVNRFAAINSTQVGMLRIPKADEICCSWSESIFTSLKRPA
jgi:hypothetical protein